MRASRWQLIRFSFVILKQFWKMVKENAREFREDDVRVWLRNPRDLRRALRKALIPEFKEFLSVTVDHQKLLRERMEEARVKLNLGLSEAMLFRKNGIKGEVEYKIRPYPFYQDATWEQMEMSLLMNNLQPAGIEQMIAFRFKYDKQLFLEPVFFHGPVQESPEGTVKVPYVQGGMVSLGQVSKETIKTWPCWILVMLREGPEEIIEEVEFSALH